MGLVSSICLISGAMGCRDVEQISATPQLKTPQGAQALVPPGGQALSPSQTAVSDRHPLGSVTRFSEALQAYSLPTEGCSVAPFRKSGSDFMREERVPENSQSTSGTGAWCCKQVTSTR